MLSSTKFLDALKENGFFFYTGVPCSFFKYTINRIVDDPEIELIMAANEGAAIGIAAGVNLSGKQAVVFLQNSGLGNMVNPLTSLCEPYAIPCLILCSGRAFRVEDEPQHQRMGQTTLQFFKEMDIEYEILSKSSDIAIEQIAWANKAMKKRNRPVALIVEKKTFEPYALKNVPKLSVNPAGLPDRREMISKIFKKLQNSDRVIVSTGFPARDAYMTCDRPQNFYVMGSMGHTSAIALGYAQGNSQDRVVLVEGDGSAIMHMGSLSTIGNYAPENLIHIILDNESHDSTGAQQTTSSTTEFSEIAKACGYRTTYCADQEQKIQELLDNWAEITKRGPVLIHIKVIRKKSEDVSRITESYSASEIAENFRNA